MPLNPVTGATGTAMFSPQTTVLKTTVEYPAAGHTLEFEPDPARYLNDLRNWVARVTRA